MPYSQKCPQCGKPVDPLRARAVALIAGEFLYYCSTSCRERQRAGREATVEVTAAQIMHADDSSKQIEILPAGYVSDTPADDEASPGAGGGLVRWAIVALVILCTAGGMVYWLTLRF